LKKLGPFELGKVHQGNALELIKKIPDNSIDLVLTDPQYGVDGGGIGVIAEKRRHKYNYSSSLDTKEYVKRVCVPIIENCIRISKAVIFTPGPKCLTYYPEPDSFGCFYQPATCGMQKWGRADSQPIFYYGKYPYLGKKIQFTSFLVTEKASCPQHPCSKPINVWTSLLLMGSKENNLILDPFMGSGTTGVACIKTERRFIGFELDHGYCKIANDRIVATKKGLTVKELKTGQGVFFGPEIEDREAEVDTL
jgi:DNA modification methylase